jgi:hypothetical protein
MQGDSRSSVDGAESPTRAGMSHAREHRQRDNRRSILRRRRREQVAGSWIGPPIGQAILNGCVSLLQLASSVSQSGFFFRESLRMIQSIKLQAVERGPFIAPVENHESLLVATRSSTAFGS